MQCDPVSYGCSGGWPYWAYNYVQSAGGLATEASYPYSSYNGVTGTCHADSSNYVIGVTGYTQITTESAMADYMLTTGPISICIDASSWGTYSSGIMSARQCGTYINHAVQAVGVNTEGSTPFWRVRNSWGTSWGENGFIRFEYGKNACGVTYSATVVSVSVV